MRGAAACSTSITAPDPNNANVSGEVQPQVTFTYNTAGQVASQTAVDSTANNVTKYVETDYGYSTTTGALTSAWNRNSANQTNHTAATFQAAETAPLAWGRFPYTLTLTLPPLAMLALKHEP